MDIKQRRRLADLYARGKDLDLAPEGQEPFMVWIRKMTPADAELAYLKAGARRASILALDREVPPSDLYLMLKSEVEQLSKENLVVWVAATEMSPKRPVLEAKIAGEKEWSEENYLTTLTERLLDEDFLKKAEEEPDNEELLRVNKELARFQEQVDKEIAEADRICKAAAETQDLEDLQKEVLKGMISAHADAAWLAEFQRCQIWRCTFEGDDHNKRLFTTRAEVDEEQVEVLERLQVTIDAVHVGDAEGKDSPPTQDSSSPSE